MDLGIGLYLGIIKYDHAIMVIEEKVLSFGKCRKVYSMANVMKVVTHFIKVQKKYTALCWQVITEKNKLC